MVTAVICDELETVIDSYMAGNGTSYNSSKKIDCYHSNRHEDGYEEKIIRCLETGKWSELSFSCDSKSLFI